MLDYWVTEFLSPWNIQSISGLGKLGAVEQESCVASRNLHLRKLEQMCTVYNSVDYCTVQLNTTLCCIQVCCRTSLSELRLCEITLMNRVNQSQGFQGIMEFIKLFLEEWE